MFVQNKKSPLPFLLGEKKKKKKNIIDMTTYIIMAFGSAVDFNLTRPSPDNLLLVIVIIVYLIQQNNLFNSFFLSGQTL